MAKPTAAELRYRNKVKELDCVACGASAPSDAHHIRSGQGTGLKAGNYLIIPLCKQCHQGEFSTHNDNRNFHNVYGSELDLLNETIGGLNK